MTRNAFVQLLREDRYQVFLFSSPVPVPLHFAVHTWFVINLKGKVHRWEFGKFRHSPHPRGIGLLKDFMPPTTGMNRYWWKTRPRFPSRLLDYISGGENSPAARLAHFIDMDSQRYPYKARYVLTGPNSNTYVKWVLRNVPGTGLRLPFNAVG